MHRQQPNHWRRRLAAPLMLLAILSWSDDIAAQFRDVETRRPAVATLPEDWIGEIFWTSPKGEALSAVEFYTAPSGSASRFEVTKDSRFEVRAIERTTAVTWVEVEFVDSPDHRRGWIMAETFERRSKPPPDPFFHWSITNYNISKDGPPAAKIRALREAHQSQERASIAAIESELDEIVAERNTRPPRIGMSEAEVLASSWGSPKDVNRTLTEGRKREQWVYPWGYVYLTNGTVTAVQD